ncbi:FAD-dependent oxidoreductase [Desertivirga xinjiangensis]|uniref:FAD-dependent oxidoreductase n=1 Tax=Desertivirga xinjiangensis TaxID=539206 RepID=UPI00210A7D88|nr:FAD-dependent oxidoreductase [Pedobacter xinjiangensis]
MGYPKDEYLETNHWSPQLYLREAGRLVADTVMTQHHGMVKKVGDFSPFPISYRSIIPKRKEQSFGACVSISVACGFGIVNAILLVPDN